MTENDPGTPQPGGVPQEAESENAAQEAAPDKAAQEAVPEKSAQEDAATPPRGTPLGAQQPPSPWSAQAQQTPGNPWAQSSSAGQSSSPGQPSGQPLQGQSFSQGQSAPQGQQPSPGQPSPPGATTGSHPYAGPYDTTSYGTAVYPATGVPQQRKRGVGKLVAGVAALALLVGGGAGWGAGYLATQNSGGGSYNALNQPLPTQTGRPAPAGTVEAVAQNVSPSVVELRTSGNQQQSEGSGFVVSTDGYIVTNNHVVDMAANGGSIQASFPDGTKAPATIIGRDPTTDIAVVKVTGVNNLKPVELGNSDDLRVGQAVVAFGSPFELTGTVTAGIVSALHRPVRAGGGSGDLTTVMSAIQTDAAINPGNSGGPLTNLAGQVIGINSAIYSPPSSGGLGQSEATNAGIGFSIPINQAQRTAQEIIRTGKATQTYIGASVADTQSSGALIQKVDPGSPADQAGLKAGDVVVKVDDQAIDNADGLVAAIRTRAPNDKVTFTLNNNRTLQVTLGGQPVQVR
nr:trypsin-like peptidase domain-containing protein [Amycolatopsis taiwanensis]